MKCDGFQEKITKTQEYMNCKKTLLMACCALFAAAVHAQVTIDIDTRQRGPKVSPMLYGIFYEDINHAAEWRHPARCPPLLAEHRQNQVSQSPRFRKGRKKAAHMAKVPCGLFFLLCMVT